MAYSSARLLAVVAAQERQHRMENIVLQFTNSYAISSTHRKIRKPQKKASLRRGRSNHRLAKFANTFVVRVGGEPEVLESISRCASFNLKPD